VTWARSPLSEEVERPSLFWPDLNNSDGQHDNCLGVAAEGGKVLRGRNCQETLPVICQETSASEGASNILMEQLVMMM